MKTLNLLSGVAALAMLAAVPAQAEDVSIGALMPLTGGLQPYGEAGLNGIKLAVKQANAAGGILNDAEVEVAVGDTQTKPQPSVDAAKKLVSIEGADVIIGALGSSNTISAASSVTAVEGVPQISSASTSPKISTLDDNGMLFRTVVSDAFQGVALGKIVMEAGYRNVGVIYVNNDYGEGLADAFRKTYEDLGGKVSASVPHEENKASYRGELSRAADGGAEALVLIAYPDSGGTAILKQALEEGYFQNFVMTDGMKAPEVVDQIGGQYLEGTIGTVAAAAGSQGRTIFLDAYKAEYGAEPDRPYVDTAYDAAMIGLLAIEMAGTTDGKAVAAAITKVGNAPGEKIQPGEFAKAKKLIAEGQDIDYEGAGGSQNFDANGDVQGLFEHWAITEGRIVTVKIFDPTK